MITLTSVETDDTQLPAIGHDLFLDFLNRDSRQYFGLFSAGSTVAQDRLLREALSVAVFLTRDACYCPPGFLLEDELVRRLLSAAAPLRQSRLVRLPVRETLDELWAKKEREYALVRENYQGLFDLQGQAFVEENRLLLVDRDFEVGSLLVRRWESAPDVAGSWSAGFVRQFPAGVVDLFRSIPRQLAEEGQAVTWATISSRIAATTKRHPRYRQLVQHIYFGIYTELMSLKIIENLPWSVANFGLDSGDLFYSYETLEQVASTGGVWTVLLSLSDDELVQIRRTAPYFAFRRAYRELCNVCEDKYTLREALALPSLELAQIAQQTDAVAKLSAGQLSLMTVGSETDLEGLEALAARLQLISEAALRRRRSALDDVARRSEFIAGMLRGGPKMSEAEPMLITERKAPELPMVAMFAALAEERDVLRELLALQPVAGAKFTWTGVIEGKAEVVLYSAMLMGRVPAAVATARLLASIVRPDAIVVLGFAGGFTEGGAELGQVVVPRSVADLASRKVQSVDEATEKRIRPEPFEISPELHSYLETHFSAPEWEMRATKVAEWPAGRRPSIITGATIICGDEVVASDEHRADLLRAWPQARGVEMESGGVLAAAREFGERGLPVYQIRVITDLADPAKSDTVWRAIGVKTLASLVAAIEWPQVVDVGRRDG